MQNINMQTCKKHTRTETTNTAKKTLSGKKEAIRSVSPWTKAKFSAW